jgi:hypothetical protein
MEIDNSTGASITLTRFFTHWVKAPDSQRLDELFLQDVSIWNAEDPNPPSDIPSEGSEGTWNGTLPERTLPGPEARTFKILFGEGLQPGLYEVHLVFDIGCQIQGSINLP